MKCECGKDDKCEYCHACISNKTIHKPKGHFIDCKSLGGKKDMSANNMENTSNNNNPSLYTAKGCSACGGNYCEECGSCDNNGCSYGKYNCLKCKGNDLLKATFSKLSNGAWVIRVKATDNGLLSYGTKIAVHKADGTVTVEQIDKYNTDKTYATNGVTGKFHFYTIVNKYKKGGYSPKPQTEESNNKPKYKNTSSGYKSSYKKKAYQIEENYNLIAWEYDETVSEYKIIAELQEIGKEAVEGFAKFYKAENEKYGNGKYVVLAPKTSNYGAYYEPSIYDVGVGSYETVKMLYGSYIAKKEAQENLGKTWIMCTMGCESFPARGQKIKGILGLSDKIKKMVNSNKILNAIVVSENLYIENVTHKHYSSNMGRVKFDDVIPYVVGKFMRPVPKVPKHGFVDSRKVNSREEIEKIIQEIRDTGETPEFIALPFIDCKYSAVITPDNIALGKGHDGATQGNGAIVLPLEVGDEQREQLSKLFWNVKEKYCPNCLKSFQYDDKNYVYSNFNWTSKNYCNELGCNNEVLLNKWPYVEVLYEDQYTYPTVVQLRSGPEMKIENEKVKVKKIVKIDSSMDLLEWDKLAHQLKGEIENSPNGKYNRIVPVVWHPGGAATSHFGVHCKDNKLPYLTSIEKPCQEGDIIEIGVKSPTNMEALKEGLILGLETPLDDLKENDRRKAKRFLKNFLAALHGYALLDLGNEDAARFVGYSFAVGARIISALPMGESRHREQPRKVLDSIIQEEWQANYAHHKFCSCGSCRGMIYDVAWKLDLEKTIKCLVVSLDGFNMPIWGGPNGVSGGFGGKKWADCTKALLDVFKGIREFIKDQSADSLSMLVYNTNDMINKLHNGAKFSWLDKLISANEFDNAHELPHFFISPEVAFRMKDELEVIKPSLDISMEVSISYALKSMNIEKLSEESVLKVELKKIQAAKKEEEASKATVYNHQEPPIVQVKPVRTYSQEKIKALILADSSIQGQYKADMGQLHIQVNSYVINKKYGFSGYYSWDGVELKVKDTFILNEKSTTNNGKGVGSLTGSANQYMLCDIYRSKKVDSIIIESGGWFVLIEDKTLANQMRAIMDWQVKAEIIKPVVVEKKEVEKEDTFCQSTSPSGYFKCTHNNGHSGDHECWKVVGEGDKKKLLKMSGWKEADVKSVNIHYSTPIENDGLDDIPF